MKIITISHEDVPAMPPCVYAAGYFDGMHRGHQELFKKAESVAHDLHCDWGILTFDPDPWTVFKPDADLSHIQSLADREKTAEALGADIFCILRFTKEFASLSPGQFHDLLKKMNVQAIVTGMDFHYGYKNSGGIDTLSKSGIQNYVVSEIQEDGRKVSSTRIEADIRKGNVSAAARLLSRPYSILGTIVHGYSRGDKLLGFPTANLKPDSGCILPAMGVYFGTVSWGGQSYYAMINVGKNPTFGNADVSIEAAIFDFSGSLYDKKVRFSFLERLRGEIRFETPEALKAQLHKDEAMCRKLAAISFPNTNNPSMVYNGTCRKR